MKQLILYEKDNGQIFRVMSFKSSSPTLDKLGVSHLNLETLIVEGNLYVDIRKDRVVNGNIHKGLAAVKFDAEINELFKDISGGASFIKGASHIGLITPWKQQCGIAKYSEDLALCLLNKVTVFCEQNDDVSGNYPFSIIPCWKKDDSSYRHLVTEIKNKRIDVVHVQYNHGLMNAGELKILETS